MLPPLLQIPPGIVALCDYEKLARERVTEDVWAYLSGGAGDEITLRKNQLAFEKLMIVPRVLRDMTGATTQTKLFGKIFPHPFLVAPTAYHTLFHKDGEMATVLGAAAMECGMCVSTLSTYSLEDIAARTTTPLWFQLYIQPDRDFTLALVRRAETAGYEALVITVDAPVSGLRNREQRAGFQLPAGIEAVNLREMQNLPPEQQVFSSKLLAAAPTWQDIDWLQAHTHLPIILKGILSPQDAKLAVEHGAAGVIISNHGGRVLDSVPASIEMLSAVVTEINRAIPVLIDGGVRRGTDALKCLALGADAVLIGRPVLHGLAAAGAVGVAHVMKILATELELAMALSGCKSIEELRRCLLISE